MKLKNINNQANNNPLSKKELKKQFVHYTKKLGLKHTFNFDEAYEIGQELKKEIALEIKLLNLKNNYKKSRGFKQKRFTKIKILLNTLLLMDVI